MAAVASPPGDSLSSLVAPFLRIPVINKRYEYRYTSYTYYFPLWAIILTAVLSLIFTGVAIWGLIHIIRKKNRRAAQNMPLGVPMVVPSQYANPGMYQQQPQQGYGYSQGYNQPANPNQHLSGYYAPAPEMQAPAPAAQPQSQAMRGFYEPSPTQGVGGQGATVK